MAILDMFALMIAAAVPAQEYDMAAQADLCATDPATVVRPDAQGITANYVFQLRSGLTTPVDAFFDALDRERFAVGTGVQTPNFSLVFVQTRRPAQDAEQVREEVRILCGFARVAKGKMSLFERLDAEARAQRDRERMQQPVISSRLEGRVPDEYASPVTREEVAALLRSPEMMRDFFDETDPGLKLGRIHAFGCAPFEKGRSSCRIGLPVYQRGEPEYIEIEADFARDAAGKLHYDPQPITVN
ncbi:hypothetical protein ACCC88_12085 [Sphingomonas sp. Sphisp140]|uniref:hypothetical protein n=1 Tax=unclassified Sphingomonas TaxID=196159 RepID=UPI0039AF23C5